METNPTSDIHLPPGFRFHPSDEELIVHYLKNKVASNPLPASIAADLDLYKFNPWDLPKKALFGEDEWYFFTPRDRKYPNGARPNRAAASGYWKATGTDKPILASCGTSSIGVKKALVFYKGRPPKGIKTDWIMHEYRLLDSLPWNNTKKKGSMRLDDWVLCRVRQKSCFPKSTWEDRNDPGYEPAAAGCFPKLNDPSNEMIKNYLHNDCPMLPYIFASQDFSCFDKPSCISLQRVDKSLASVIYDGNAVDKNNFQFSVTALDSSLSNPLNRKQKTRIPPSKKVIAKDTDYEKEDIAVITASENGNDDNFYGRNQTDGTANCSPIQWNSLMQYQELDHLAFTGDEFTN